jgi:Family of unknown function (DUF5681)
MEKLMPVDFLQEQEGRDADGRFMKGYSGNPDGRPPRRRNKATEAAEVLLDGEVEALTSLRSTAKSVPCASVSTASFRRAGNARSGSTGRRCAALPISGTQWRRSRSQPRRTSPAVGKALRTGGRSP